jgi:hypothetical protein
MKADVRQHALLMLGRANNLSSIPGPPEPHIVEGYNVNKTGGPSKRRGRLKLDLDGPVRSPWNVRAAVCFRKDFNKSGLYRSWPNDLVEEAFLRHIETIRVNYHRQIGRVPASTVSERQIRSARRSRVKTVSLHYPAYPRLTLIQPNSSFSTDSTSAMLSQIFPDSLPM